MPTERSKTQQDSQQPISSPVVQRRIPAVKTAVSIFRLFFGDIVASIGSEFKSKAATQVFCVWPIALSLEQFEHVFADGFAHFVEALGITIPLGGISV
ncbi:MAG: hypothetical protein ABGX22_04310, partial [Pirellulaceae bacterium]